jgi:DNA gyrase inhibitor GyrI
MANNTGEVIAVFQRSILEWYPTSHAFRRFNRKMNIGIDSTPNVVNCITKDSIGNVYVPIESGIAVFKNILANYDIRPRVNIVYTTVNQLKISVAKHEFPYDENDFTFHFSGVNLTHPDPLNYRYMLKGYKERWITTNDETVNFPRLPPGRYTFFVQSSSNNDFSHACQYSYNFVIEAPYWRKSWFIGFVILLIVVLANIYIRQRLSRLRNVSRLQEERMEFEYEHLKSQVNPHFLFNSLNTLTSLIEENKENAVEYTIKLSDLYRNMLAFKDKDLVLLQEEWEILNNYIYIQQSRFGKALVLEHQIPDEVMRKKKIIPMALQLLVENAIKHNIVSASQPLLINITANEEEIVVSNKISPKVSKEKSAGIGLQNISNRYKLLINRPIQYGIIGNHYVVKLPLL